VQEDSVASWVESDEKQQISKILSDVNIWLSSCRDAIAAPTTDPSFPLKDMLSRVRLVRLKFFLLSRGFLLIVCSFSARIVQ